jgi:hypothetical protein
VPDWRYSRSQLMFPDGVTKATWPGLRRNGLLVEVLDTGTVPFAVDPDPFVVDLDPPARVVADPDEAPW